MNNRKRFLLSILLCTTVGFNFSFGSSNGTNSVSKFGKYIEKEYKINFDQMMDIFDGKDIKKIEAAVVKLKKIIEQKNNKANNILTQFGIIASLMHIIGNENFDQDSSNKYDNVLRTILQIAQDSVLNSNDISVKLEALCIFLGIIDKKGVDFVGSENLINIAEQLLNDEQIIVQACAFNLFSILIDMNQKIDQILNLMLNINKDNLYLNIMSIRLLGSYLNKDVYLNKITSFVQDTLQTICNDNKRYNEKFFLVFLIETLIDNGIVLENSINTLEVLLKDKNLFLNILVMNVLEKLYLKGLYRNDRFQELSRDLSPNKYGICKYLFQKKFMIIDYIRSLTLLGKVKDKNFDSYTDDVLANIEFMKENSMDIFFEFAKENDVLEKWIPGSFLYNVVNSGFSSSLSEYRENVINIISDKNTLEIVKELINFNDITIQFMASDILESIVSFTLNKAVKIDILELVKMLNKLLDSEFFNVKSDAANTLDSILGSNFCDKITIEEYILIIKKLITSKESQLVNTGISFIESLMEKNFEVSKLKNALQELVLNQDNNLKKEVRDCISYIIN